MSIIKKAIFSHNCSIRALNSPKGEGWNIFNLPNQIKTASTNVESEDLGGYDLKTATKDHPDHLFVKIFAIKKDEPNDNGDSFSEAELKIAAPTFVGVPLFTNHQNDVVEKARGECVHSWYDGKDGGIYIVGRVDKIAYPRLARGIEEGYIKGTSMGCSVEHSLCSVCHNLAHTSDEYCTHIANKKNRKFSGEIKCRYHERGSEDKCPLCESSKNSSKSLKHSEQSIFEHNYGLKFIENSFVVNPACHDCGVSCVLHIPEVNKKISSLNETVNSLIKNASEDSEFFEENAENIVKLGGVKELESLKDSMGKMEHVVKSMLQQKENISMEYVSDLVKAMSDVQNIYDELVEMGYGALPSPAIVAETSPQGSPMETFPNPVPKPTLSPSSGGTAQTSDMGGLGNITTPKKSSKKIEDFYKNNQTLINKISSLSENIKEFTNYRGAIMATPNKNTKVASGSDSLEVITEKQLEKKDTDLHPRTDEVYEGITESKEQLAGSEKSNDTNSSSPQVRMGTYETITEDQLKNKSSFGESIIHFNDYPDVITEKQWDDFAKSAGGVEAGYPDVITQAQIRDLLSGHKFIGDVETITEDQLRNISMTDGLKRWARKDYSISLIKSAMNAVADIIDKYKKSPEEIRKIATLISDDDQTRQKASFLAIVNSVPEKQEGRKALASRASYFSKTASVNPVSTMDSFIISASENGQTGMKVEDLFDFMGKVLSDKSAMEKVEKIVAGRKNNNVKVISKTDAFKSALKEMDKPLDGKYRIKATMEDVGAPITDKVAFVKGVKKLAQEMIADNSVASAVIKIEVAEDGSLVIDVEDSNVVGEVDEVSPDDMGNIGDMIEENVEEEVGADLNGNSNLNETENIDEGGEIGEKEENPQEENTQEEEKPCMAEAKKEIKKAQMMGGEMGGQGGASQAPGAGATLPAVPGAGAGPAPLESFENEGLGDEEGDMGEDKEALPPGSICPVCGSEDVNIVAGKGKCNNCNSEMTYKVEINVTKWQGVTPTEEEAEGEEGGLEGEGFEMPEAGAEEAGLGAGAGAGAAGAGAGAGAGAAEMPAVAAYTRLNPEALKKLAERKIELGSISPATGTVNTVKVAKGEYICMDTGTKYKVSFVIDASNPKKGAYAQWEWTPKVPGSNCKTCERVKQKFVKALSTIGMPEEQFDALDITSKVNTIVKLKKAGTLGLIKTASKEGSVLADYKLAYGNWGNSFPIESCIEKLSRRFGENAVCLSGPDEGKPLASSICNRLKKADVYTDKIAIKLAESWSDCDGDEECVTHQVRAGYSLREAASICDTLKVAVAQAPDFFADELSNGDGNGGEAPTEEAPTEEAPMDDNFDPFDGGDDGSGGGGSGGNITLELPADLVEQLDKSLDVALGENPQEEEHHQDADLDGTPNAIDETPMGEDPNGAIGGSPVEEQIAPGELGETSQCTDFKQDISPESGPDGKNNKGVLDQTKKVTVRINGQDVNGGESKPVEDAEEFNSSDDEGNVFAQKEYTKKEAMSMKNSIGKVGRAQMDLTGVVAVLNKKADKQISQEKAQDSKDIGEFSAGEKGSLMGHENETIRTPQKPSVPRDKALMGQESDDLNPQDKPQPTIPSGDATMGHEKEVGLSGGDSRYTGGDKGQGKIETASLEQELYHMRGFGSNKSALKGLAEKVADKLQPKKPVSEDKDIQPISDGGTIGKEEKFDAKEPKDVEGSATESLIGHEKETLEKAPKEPADQPDVYTGNAQMGKEELNSEKTTKDKGTVIASSNSESEAIRVAGRMLQTKKIGLSDLQSKINELKAYRSEQIKDIERSIFANKGLDTVTEGMSQPVQINEASSVRNSNENLTSKLQALFRLDAQNKLAESEDLTAIRKAYGR